MPSKYEDDFYDLNQSHIILKMVKVAKHIQVLFFRIWIIPYWLMSLPQWTGQQCVRLGTYLTWLCVWTAL